jgi:predicted amidohydrolase YtcJ
MQAEILIKSDCIFTAAGGPVFSGYIAVSSGKIIAAEPGEPPAKLLGPTTKVYDLAGHTVCPGFIDTHCFFTGWALCGIGADLSQASTLDELMASVQAYADTLALPAPVFGHGWKDTLNPADSEEFGKNLNEAFASRPVALFSASGENCLLNRAAMERYGFDQSQCYPEAMWKLLEEMMNDLGYIVPKFREYMKMLNARGVTSVKEMGFDDYYGFTDILEGMEKAGELTLRVNFMSQPVGAGANFSFGKRMRTRFNGGFVRFSGYNRMTDGSVSQLCADLKKAYSCRPDTCCIQNIDWNLIAEETRAADAEGFRFSLHAQGDGAISKVLGIYETCKRGEDGRLINRHAITDLELSDPADLERMGRLGAVAEIYPQIQSIASRDEKLSMINDKIGSERRRHYWNRRKMIDSGVVVSCATDLPLMVDDIPASVYHACGGFFPEGGKPFNLENMITREELLSAWCFGGAYNLGLEDMLGTLSNGKIADITVLNGNIFSEGIGTVRDIKVCLTILGGNVVFEKI